MVTVTAIKTNDVGVVFPARSGTWDFEVKQKDLTEKLYKTGCGLSENEVVSLKMEADESIY